MVMNGNQTFDGEHSVVYAKLNYNVCVKFIQCYKPVLLKTIEFFPEDLETFYKLYLAVPRRVFQMQRVRKYMKDKYKHFPR